jgi:hypothetical protein
VYSGQEGFISSTVTYNSTGAAIGLALETEGESFDSKLECTNDGHENWATCQQVVKPAGVTVGKAWRRTITYRESSNR